MNNHQNAIFHQLDNFIKHSHSFAMTIFHKITNSAKQSHSKPQGNCLAVNLSAEIKFQNFMRLLHK
jgi:hypothetical protein